jgi:lipopolysaccharide transport system ATP-binding protein
MAIIEVSHVTKEFRLGELHSVKQSVFDAMARLRGRSARQRAPFKALDDVDFKVESGEVLGIIGHNGAGKSTLLKMLAGISKPTRGSIAVRGTIAPLIEVGAGLVDDLSGRENIFLNASILGLKRVDIARKFDEIVAFAELEEFIDTPIKRYSSGMKVKLGFAVATSIESEILIVDEVLAVGDLAFQRKCFDRMEDLIKRQGRTVLLVSHNIRQVERLCTRVLLLEHGKVINDGAPTDTCNLFYEISDKRIHETKLSAAAGSGRTATSGNAEVESVVMFDEHGNAVNEIGYLDDVEIRVGYRVLVDLPDPIFGIGVHTTDFLYLATSQSIGSLPTETLLPGHYVLSYKIRRFPFLPGVYSLRLGVALGGSFQPVLYSENALSFQVLGKDINRAVQTGYREGFVALDGDWELSARDLDDATSGPGSRRDGVAYALDGSGSLLDEHDAPR